MTWNTLKTIWGFLGTLLRNALPSGLYKGSFESIYNYRKISDRLHTSGQPSAEQFAQIKERGFNHVINLVPSNHENALPNQGDVLEKLGVTYTHIPVDFKAPQESDFEQFVQVMQAAGDEPVWVHCAANMRVSAFVYRYRRDILQEDEGLIRKDLEAIWEPFGVWKAFLKPL